MINHISSSALLEIVISKKINCFLELKIKLNIYYKDNMLYVEF